MTNSFDNFYWNVEEGLALISQQYYHLLAELPILTLAVAEIINLD